MSNAITLAIDPVAVLGVSPESTLQEIRDAYRAKAKKYHPDAGGEEWAFRILVQAYETLCTSRVARATEREYNAYPDRPTPTPAQARAAQQAARPHGFGPTAHAAPEPPPTRRPRPDSTEWVRQGVEEPAGTPARVVEVEKISVLFEADQIWLISDRNTQNRILSCSLNITWPDTALMVPPSTIPDFESTLASLDAIVSSLVDQTHPLSSNVATVDGRFSAWLSYPTDERATDALAQLRTLLHDESLSLKRRSRDLLIPRNWR